MKNPLCIYHGNCADGFTAAWAVHSFFGPGNVDFYAGVHQDPPPDVTDRDVIIVDFSYKAAILNEMASAANSILILDHHKTAQADLAEIAAFCRMALQAIQPIPIRQFWQAAEEVTNVRLLMEREADKFDLSYLPEPPDLAIDLLRISHTHVVIVRKDVDTLCILKGRPVRQAYLSAPAKAGNSLETEPLKGKRALLAFDNEEWLGTVGKRRDHDTQCRQRQEELIIETGNLGRAVARELPPIFLDGMFAS